MKLCYGLICGGKCKSNWFIEIDGYEMNNIKCILCNREFHLQTWTREKEMETTEKIINFIKLCIT